jgi:hypothetical protein
MEWEKQGPSGTSRATKVPRPPGMVMEEGRHRHLVMLRSSPDKHWHWAR